MTEFKMNLNFEGQQPTEQLDEAGRTIYDITTTSLKAPHFSYENDTSEYPSDICAKLASIPLTHYSGTTSVSIDVDPWRAIVLSAPFITNTVGVKYVRFDVKVIVRVASSIGAYGNIRFTYCPINYPTGCALANGDPILVDIGKGDVTEFILPWEIPYDFYNLSHSMSVGKLIVRGSSYNIYSTSPAAQFDLIFTPVNVRAKGARASLQMEQGTDVRAYPAAATLATIAAITSGASYGMDYIRGITNNVKNVVETGSQLYNDAQPYVEQLQWKNAVDEPKEEPVSNTPNIYGNLSSFDYVPASAVTRPKIDIVKPYHLGDIEQTHVALRVAKIPCIRYSYRSLAVGLVKTLHFEPGIFEANQIITTYCDNISRLFRYWRGSMDINFQFFLPATASATFRFFMRNAEAYSLATALPPAVDDTYAYAKEFTLHGSGVVSLRLPYISSSQWTRTGLTSSTGNFTKVWETGLVMTRVNSPGDLPLLPVIIVIARPGPDFQFKSVGSSCTVAAAQMRVFTDFQEPDNSWIPKTPKRYRPVPEDTMTLEEICNRWSSRLISQNNLSTNTSGVPLIQVDNLDYIMSMFAYQRGAVRWLTYAGGTSTAPVIYEGSGSFGYSSTARILTTPAGRGVVIGDPTTNPVVKFETVWDSTLEWGLTLPFLEDGYSVDPFYFADEWYGSQVLISNFAEQTTFAYAAAGRGFQIARLLPPLDESVLF